MGNAAEHDFHFTQVGDGQSKGCMFSLNGFSRRLVVGRHRNIRVFFFRHLLKAGEFGLDLSNLAQVHHEEVQHAGLFTRHGIFR